MYIVQITFRNNRKTYLQSPDHFNTDPLKAMQYSDYGEADLTAQAQWASDVRIKFCKAVSRQDFLWDRIWK